MKFSTFAFLSDAFSTSSRILDTVLWPNVDVVLTLITPVRLSVPEITLSLKDINYKKTNFETYSYNTRFLEEKIAEFIGTTNNEVQVAEESLFFVMSKLSSKKVKIIPQTNLVFEKQYNYYGIPVSIPDSATIFGALNDIKDIQFLQTEFISKKNVNQSIDITLNIIV